MTSSNNLLENDSRDGIFRVFGTRTRFMLMPLVLLCLSFIWANILSFNLVVICINDPAGDNGTIPNHYGHTHTISSNEETYAIASMAAGAFVGNFVVVFLVNKFGMRTVFGVLGLLSSVATLLMPLAIHGGFAWLIVCRVLQGIAFAANFPAIGAFAAKWIYHKQSGLFVSVLVSYVQIAPIFTNPVGGALCGTLGWASIFYVHGGISAILFILYSIFFRNSPAKHPFVGPHEAEKVSRGKATGKSQQSVPYKKILNTPGIWAIWIAALGNFVIINVFFIFTPTYLSKVLGFSVSNAGFSAMYPPLAQLVTKIGTGVISDKIKSISETSKYRIFNSISFIGAALPVFALAYIGKANPDANSPVMAIALAILGINTGGFYKAAPTLSKQYSAFVTGYISQCNCLVLLVIPFFVQAIAPDNTVQQWKIVFIAVAGTLIITNCIFVVFIQGEPFSWTDAEIEKQASPPSPIPSISIIRVHDSNSFTKPPEQLHM